MKSLHECAVIKGGNKRVGYFVVDVDSNSPTDVVQKHWILVGKDNFESLVQQNRVQYLVWEDNTIKCRYTEEERFELKRHHMNDDVLALTEKYYFDMDVTFKCRHINLSSQIAGSICVSFGSPNKTFGVTLIPIYMCGYVPAMIGLLDAWSQRVNNNLMTTFKHNNSHIGSVIVPVRYLDVLADELVVPRNLFCNTSTCKFILGNKLKTPAIPIVAGRVKNTDEILRVMDKLDNVTSRLESKLTIPSEFNDAILPNLLR